VKAHNKPLLQKQFRETKESQNCFRCGGEDKSYINVFVLLGVSPASDCNLPTFRNPLSVPSSKAVKYPWKGVVAGNIHAATPSLAILHLPAYEDGTDREFRNVGQEHTDAGDLPKRKKTIKVTLPVQGIEL
jgi:hypothetical protein